MNSFRLSIIFIEIEVVVTLKYSFFFFFRFPIYDQYFNSFFFYIESCINIFTELGLPRFDGFLKNNLYNLEMVNVGLYPNFTLPFNPILFTKMTHPKDNF